jgi:hypothetical protein
MYMWIIDEVQLLRSDTGIKPSPITESVTEIQTIYTLQGKTWQDGICTVPRTLGIATFRYVPPRSKSLLYTRDKILVPQWLPGPAVILDYFILPWTTTIE